VRGVDTNILIRYLTADDSEQSLVVQTLLKRAATEGEQFHVSTIVLCEVVWVLRTVYRYTRKDIVSALESLLEIQVLEIQDLDLAQRALDDFRVGAADFADYLIGWQNWRVGCTDTLTFDRDLKGSPGFTLLS
jgi:predicted nucleic-acid-binding protein